MHDSQKSLFAVESRATVSSPHTAQLCHPKEPIGFAKDKLGDEGSLRTRFLWNHHRDSSLHCVPLRMTSLLIHPEETFGFAQDKRRNEGCLRICIQFYRPQAFVRLARIIACDREPRYVIGWYGAEFLDDGWLKVSAKIYTLLEVTLVLYSSISFITWASKGTPFVTQK